MELTAAPKTEIPYSEINRRFIFEAAYIKMPEKTDCKIEMIKNGEKRIPATAAPATDLKSKRMKNDFSGSENADKTAAFESPGLKNGTMRGKIASAYDRESAFEMKNLIFFVESS